MKDIPTKAAGQLAAMTRSDNPTMANWAFDALEQLREASPSAFDSRIPNDVASKVEFWRTGKDYYPQDKLMQIINGGDQQEMRVRTEALRKEADGLLKDSKEGPKIKGDIAAQMGGGSGGILGFGGVANSSFAPSVTAMKQEFEDLFKVQYGMSGDPVLAKEQAITLLKKQWDVTDVGGTKILMKFPPQKVGYTPIQDSYNWMTEQARQDLRLGPNDKFQLVSDGQTEAEFGAWQVGKALASTPLPTTGLDIPGNIDLTNRPRVKMEDGSTATVRSISIEEDGQEVLLPTVSPDGKLWTHDEAIANYKSTGEHLGKFADQASAEKYAQALHMQQAGTLMVVPPSYQVVIQRPDGTWNLFEPWAKAFGNRITFDMKPFQPAQAKEWSDQAIAAQKEEAARLAGTSRLAQNATGVPVPSDVQDQIVFGLGIDSTNGGQ